MYSDRLLDRFRNPRHAGEAAPPALAVRVENPVCGDLLELSVRIEGERITEARFKAMGCPPSIACASVAAEWLEGRTLPEAGRLSGTEIEEALGGLPAASRHAVALALDAVRAILERATSAGSGG